ncbi:hypothetical protein [Undibacterium sp. Ji22W]|uniref:hypothetical protein n=1 Tax=Undibacterium sp. Ji22W TaxID=3413038 RepID=UPI003BF21536
MTKILCGLLALLSLCACASVETVETDDPNQAKVAVEREYRVGSTIPQKKNARSNTDVKTVSSDDLINMPRAATPTDPLGKK